MGFIIGILVLLTVMSPYTNIIPAIYMTYMVLFKKTIIYKNHWNIGLCLLFIWSLIVGVVNYSFMSIALSFIFFIYLCISVFLQNYFQNENKVEKICRYLVFFSLLSAIFGIIEKAIHVYFNYNIWAKFLKITSQPVFNDRIYSTFGNPNVAGNWFAIMILLSLYFCSTTSKTTKLFYQIATFFFVIALYLTGSRGAFMGLLFGLFTFYLVKGNKKDMWPFITIFILTAVVTFMPSQILENVIGHNIWITIMTSLGIVGMFIYTYMKINLFRNLKILYTHNCRLVPVLAGIQAVIIGHGLVDFTMISPQTGLLFIASSAIISALVAQYNGLSGNCYEVSATSQEISEVTDKIAQSAGILDSSSKEMIEKVSRFKI